MLPWSLHANRERQTINQNLKRNSMIEDAKCDGEIFLKAGKRIRVWDRGAVLNKVVRESLPEKVAFGLKGSEG